MNREDPPFCITCIESVFYFFFFFLEHVLLHCSNLIDVGARYFHANSLKILFRDVSVKIITAIQDIYKAPTL